MKRAYYSNSIRDFIKDDSSKILGELNLYHSFALEELQRNAWIGQIQILKDQLKHFEKGQLYFEFAIPRMGKRVDVILIIKDIVFVIEFKVGDGTYGNHAIEQVIDYTLDLRNFHEGSHHAKLIPVIVSTNAEVIDNNQHDIESYLTAAKTNGTNLGRYLNDVVANSNGENVDVRYWETSIYKPTPTIVEAAQALYKGHNVQEISRSDSGAINLSKTADCLNEIIDHSKTYEKKSICFITGVPGAGKTLAGLNIAVERMKSDKDEHAVFLSGNGPLVEVLREALVRDEVLTTKEKGDSITKKQAAIKANAFIQNIHHFRDDNLISEKAPVEKVVVFDEAQRAWTNEKATAFMKVKKGIADFNMSEPEFLIDVMNRHEDWCTIICLIGGGQEINTGEAGLEAWIEAIKDHYGDWDVHYSNLVIENNNYITNESFKTWLKNDGISEQDLHLGVSIRSFRSEQLSNFIHELLEINFESAKNLFDQIKEDFPIVMTRDLEIAKNWLRGMAKGTERTGVVGSSGARRLRSFGIDVKNEISASNWFLDGKEDVRSSYFLEVVATEFDIQGLEIDWVCLTWGADFFINNNEWNYQKFKGSKWQNINKEIIKQYLKNAYRVLLTRARQGMVIFIPEGSDIDHTRPNEFYDGTYNYLKELGIKTLTKDNYTPIVLKKINKPTLKIKSVVNPTIEKQVNLNFDEPVSKDSENSNTNNNNNNNNNNDDVGLNSIVKISYLSKSKIVKFQIVEDHIDSSKNESGIQCIKNTSAIAKALIGRKVGDIIQLNRHNPDTKISILRIAKGNEQKQKSNIAPSSEPNYERIGKLVKRELTVLISQNLLSDSEIRNLQRADYSREHFHIQYPLLKKALNSDPNNIDRYWAGKVKIKGSEYFICSEWYEQPTNNDRPYFLRWLRKIKN
ncbi:MAG: DNA/RNA helicase domain-containing protein [Psychroserpens sp.]|uniref:DNA/RNA helicase domain-containing protein n=1 Tax=Psychroserpens sp. TaxID=2020870 RepID=UPI00300380C2